MFKAALAEFALHFPPFVYRGKRNCPLSLTETELACVAAHNEAVFFDYQTVNDEGEPVLWMLYPETTDRKRYLSQCSKQAFVEIVNNGFETQFNEVINPFVEVIDGRLRSSGQKKKQTIHPNALPRLKRGRRL